MKPPVIILAFAQDRSGGESRSLRALAAEMQALEEALHRAEVADACKIVTLADVTVAALNRTLDAYNDRIVGFHFGRHAGPTRLQSMAAMACPSMP